MRPTLNTAVAFRHCLGAGMAVLLLAPLALAGGGPTNVLLVVNANSDDSKQVANHYAKLRGLPASQVVYLDYKGPPESCGAEVFRTRILQPVLEAIDERGLGLQIDLIAYSCGFPWRVNLTSDFPEEMKFAPQLKPIASLTGATSLFAFVMGKHPGVVSQDANWYVPAPQGQSPRANLNSCRTMATVESRAFRSRYAWQAGGVRSDQAKAGRRYLLATMLGVTTGRGNRVEEVLSMLERSVQAEAKPPEGTFYFMRRNAPRSTPRHTCYQPVTQQLRELGAKALVQVGATPAGAQDIAGAMMGAKDLRLAGLRFQPGAIAEHLTSYGGNLQRGAGQTPLSELIRAGATGSCGTVAEPFAIQCKFPLPSLHLHYRRGCSLAESFYQAVASPYQLLIVGDPLCQPWATRPKIVVQGWPGSGPQGLDLSGLGDFGISQAASPPKNAESPETEQEQQPAVALSLLPLIAATAGDGAPFWELYVDGRLRMRLPSGAKADFTAEQLGPGWHELRCVAMNPDPIESQQALTGSIEILNTTDGPIEPVRLRIDEPSVGRSERLAVSASAPGAERIVIRHHLREVGVIDGAAGGALIPSKRLGRGPVRLQAIAEPSRAASPPVWITVN